jgi:hypothetical protein
MTYAADKFTSVAATVAVAGYALVLLVQVALQYAA